GAFMAELRSGRRVPMKVSNVVLMVPGFFGSDRLAGSHTFADRAIAALRGHLEAEVGSPFPVIPLALGTGEGLAARQRRLLEAMGEIDRTLGGVTRIHLLGHGTGGLDSDLLLSNRPLEGRFWTTAEKA